MTEEDRQMNDIIHLDRIFPLTRTQREQRARWCEHQAAWLKEQYDRNEHPRARDPERKQQMLDYRAMARDLRGGREHTKEAA
jgi:antirestriction protein